MAKAGARDKLKRRASILADQPATSTIAVPDEAHHVHALEGDHDGDHRHDHPELDLGGHCERGDADDGDDEEQVADIDGEGVEELVAKTLLQHPQSAEQAGPKIGPAAEVNDHLASRMFETISPQ